MTLVPVDTALTRLLDGVEPLPAETVPLAEAGWRVLDRDVRALRTHPPFPASAMDGYAVRAADIQSPPARLDLIGESAAGRRFGGTVGPGQAVRIFTGAPVPEGADAILLQEDARALPDGTVEALEATGSGRHIRVRGLDFEEGEILLKAGRILDPAALSLAAAANHAALDVVRRPLVALLATGDELVPPGSRPGPDQIVASNAYGIAALAEGDGARVLDLGIAGDDRDAIGGAVRKAQEASADVIVTLGGVSVGEHDLVQDTLTGLGMELELWKIAMRPGKPLMIGRLDGAHVLGIPGNPVSGMVCGHLFLRPLISRLGGRTHRPDLREAVLGGAMRENGQRRDYVRASVFEGSEGLVATPFSIQDSSMLKTLAAANGLIVREPSAPAAKTGENCRVLMIR